VFFTNLFVRFPRLPCRTRAAFGRPKASDNSTPKGEIRALIGGKGRQVPKEHALSDDLWATLGNEDAARLAASGTLNVTQGKNFDASGSLGPWIVPADEVDPGKPLHLMTRVNVANCARTTTRSA